MSPSSQSSTKQQFSVLLDPKLIEQVMEHTDTPGDAVEEGLQLWLAQQQKKQSTTPFSPSAQRSPAPGKRRRPSVIPSPQDYPPLGPQRSQTGAITPAARHQSPSRGLELDLEPPQSQEAAPTSGPGQLRKAFSRPNLPHQDTIPPRRRIDHLPIDERRSSNDDETGWLV